MTEGSMICSVPVPLALGLFDIVTTCPANDRRSRRVRPLSPLLMVPRSRTCLPPRNCTRRSSRSADHPCERNTFQRIPEVRAESVTDSLLVHL